MELDGYVAANTRDQFIEAKLNRLANLVELAELTASGLLDALNDIGLGIDARWPLVLRLQDHEAVRDVRRHRVGRHLGGTRFREHQLDLRSEEHTSELQSLMRISYAVFCLKKKKI